MSDMAEELETAMADPELFVGVDPSDVVRRSLARSHEAVSELRLAIESIRGEIARLREARNSIKTARISRDDAIRRIDAWIEKQRAELVTRLYINDIVGPEVDGDVSFRDMSIDQGRFSLQLAAAAGGKEFKNFLISAIEKHLGADGGLPVDGREEKIEEIEGDLLDYELSEESLIRAAENAGFPVLRRAEADSRAVLASDGALTL